jgi:UDP-N-acetylglucosamine--N-acetylmuramyl-(pentapeptide) pyrophosphoryl-undecaprenol N-acetylglucosamine transferase
MIAGGGTGGHLFPGLAVAEAARRADPATSILFVGSARGIEARVLPGTPFPLEMLPVAPLRGRGAADRLRAVSALARSVGRARRLVKDFAPDAVIGLGGYASAPAVIAARLAHRPVVLLEQNAAPGMTTRLLARAADRICVSFPETVGALPGGKAILTGNPVRWRPSAEGARAAGAGRTILIFGGSAGARRLNDAGPEMAAALAGVAGLRIIHQTGADDEAAVRDAYRARGVDAEVHAFITDMGRAYAAADLVVCRAGATTLAELAGLGKAAVLVPYPFAADDHQRANAESRVRAGAARMVLDADATGARLAREVHELLAAPETLQTMGERMRALGLPDAAERVLAVTWALAGGKGRGH